MPAEYSTAIAPKPRPSFVKKCGLPVALVALVTIMMLPQPAGLSIAGQHMLGIFAFAG
jgi:hypothetical protein